MVRQIDRWPAVGIQSFIEPRADSHEFRQRPRFPSPTLTIESHKIEVKNHVQFVASFVNEYGCLFERHAKRFTNCHNVILRQHLTIHLLQIIVKPRARGIDIFRPPIEVLREIRETLILGNKGDHIHSETPMAPNADISLAVIHKLAERPAPARHSSSSRKLVINCAAGDNFVGGRPASARSRSPRKNRKTVSERLPVEPEALAPTSNRKTPQEGHHISLVDSRAKRRNYQRQQRQSMNDSEQWKQHRAFGAVDWASDKHSVIIVP